MAKARQGLDLRLLRMAIPFAKVFAAQFQTMYCPFCLQGYFFGGQGHGLAGGIQRAANTHALKHHPNTAGLRRVRPAG